MDNDECDYMIELMQRDDEISNLQSVIYEISECNANMKRTIEILLKKCTKRGEYHAINVVFDTHFQASMKNLNVMNIKRYLTTTQKDVDVLSALLVEMFIGKDKSIIPFVFVDRTCIIYKNNSLCFLVLTIDDLVSRMYMFIKNHITNSMHAFLQHDGIMSDDIRVVNIFNHCLDFETFDKCAKKAIKVYDTYLT